MDFYFRFIKNVVLVCFLCFYSLVASAAFAGNELTLEKLIEEALTRNQLIKSQEFRIEEIRQKANQSRAWQSPFIEGSLGNKKETSGSGILYEFSVNQTLPVLGRQNSIAKILNSDLESKNLETSTLRQKITIEITKIVFALSNARKESTILAERKKTFELIQAYLSGRPLASPQEKVQKNIVTQHIRQLEKETIENEAQIKILSERLNFYTPVEAVSNIQLKWLSGGRLITQEELLKKVLARNPEILEQSLAVQKAQRFYELATIENWTDPTISGSYNEASGSEQNYLLGLGISIPLWGGNQAGIESAKQGEIFAQKIMAYQIERIKNEFNQKMLAYDSAQKIVLKYPPMLIEELKSSLKDAEIEFRKGRLDLLTLLELDNQFSETVTQALVAQQTLSNTILEIMMLYGETEIAREIANY
jgi:outer membrane protein TolC